MVRVSYFFFLFDEHAVVINVEASAFIVARLGLVHFVNHIEFLPSGRCLHSKYKWVLMCWLVARVKLHRASIDLLLKFRLIFVPYV